MKQVHENSTASLNEEKKRGRPEIFRKKIWDFLFSIPYPSTDRRIMKALGEDDVNNIRPEITRLKQDGLIREAGKVACEFTGKKVRLITTTGSDYFPRKKKGYPDEKGQRSFL